MAIGTDDDMDDFDFDGDMDLSEFGIDDDLTGVDTMDSGPERSAVAATLADTKDVFIDAIVDNPGDTIADIAKRSVPKSLSKESALLDEVTGTLSEEYDKAGKAIRTEASKTFNTIKRFVPDSNETVNGFMDKISSFLGDGEEGDNKQSKATLMAERLAADLASTMGSQDSISSVESLITQQLEANRHKSMQDLAAMSGVNVERIRKFHFEVTNNYYVKSIELGLKSLYVQQETLDVTKTGFELFKTQFEALIKNTGLPDVVKLRKTEAFRGAITQSAANTVTDNLFGNTGTIGNFRKKFSDFAKDKTEDVLSALETTETTVSGLSTAKDAGLTTGMIAGGGLVDYGVEKIADLIGTLIEKTETGKDAIYNIKTKSMDVHDTLKTLSQDYGDSPLVSAILEMATEFTRNNEASGYTIDNSDMSETNHMIELKNTTLVKTIPAYLDAIHSELKAQRLDQTSPEDHNMVFNRQTDKLETIEEAKDSVRQRGRKSIEDGAGMYSQDLARTLATLGKMDLSDDQVGVLRNSLIEYIFSKEGSLNPDYLQQHRFIKFLPDDIAKKYKKGIRHIDASMRDPDSGTIEGLGASLESIRSSIPTFKTEMTDLAKQGHSKLGEDLGILKRDELTNTLKLDREGLQKYILDEVSRLDTDRIDKGIAKAKSEAEERADNKPGIKNVFKKKDKKPGFSKGGPTDQSKGVSEEAGTVHGKEYVLSASKLKELMSAVETSGTSTINRLVGEITDKTKKAMATDVGKSVAKGVAKTQASVANKLDEMDVSIDSIQKEQRVNNAVLDDMLDGVSKLTDRAKAAATTSARAVRDSSLGKKISGDDVGAVLGKAKVPTVEEVQHILDIMADGYEDVRRGPTVARMTNAVKDVAANGYVKKAVNTTTPYAEILAGAVKSGVTDGIKTAGDLKDSVSMPDTDTVKEFMDMLEDRYHDVDRSVAAARIRNRAKKLGTNEYVKKVMDTSSPYVESTIDAVRDTADAAAGSAKEFKTKSNAERLEYVAELLGKLREGVEDGYDTLRSNITDGYKSARGKFVGIYDDLTPEQKETLRLEFFGSNEYITGKSTRFSDWLAEAKNINPGSLSGNVSKLMEFVTENVSRLNPLNKLSALRDELLQEAQDRVSGKGLKELTTDEENDMREVFFGSLEYKRGLVTDFDVWLATYSYRRSGTGIFGRVRKKLTVKNILKNTRALDKAIVGGVLKGGWKGISGAGKILGRGVSAVGTKAMGGIQVTDSDPAVAKSRLSGILGKTIRGGPDRDAKALNSGASAVGAVTGVVGRTGTSLAGMALKAGVVLPMAALDGVASLIPGYSMVKRSKTANMTKAKQTVRDIAQTPAALVKRMRGKVDAGDIDTETDTGPEESVMEKVKRKTSYGKDNLTETMSTLTEAIKKLSKEYSGDRDDDKPTKREAMVAKNKARFNKLFAKTEKNIPKESVIKESADGDKESGYSTLANMAIIGALGVGGLMLSKLDSINEGILYMQNLPTTLMFNLRKALSKIPLLASLVPSETEWSELNAKLDPNSLSGEEKVTNAMGVGSTMAAIAGTAYAGKKVIDIKRGIDKRSVEKAELKERKARVASKTAKKTKGKSLISKVRRLKAQVLKKFGKKMAAKLLAKIALRFIPLTGLILLAVDFVAYSKYRDEGYDVDSSISLAILGIDVFEDTAEGTEQSKLDTMLADYDIKNKSVVEATHKFRPTRNITAAITGEKDPSVIPMSKSVFTGGRIPLDTTPLNNDTSLGNLSLQDNVDIKNLNPTVLKHLAGMSHDYFTKTGKKLQVNSGFRSMEHQKRLKAKYGDRAAAPGTSLHEFGLAVDINSGTANELEKLGLMRKYGFTRPVGGEPWHLEPAGIQLALSESKRDPNLASKLVHDSLFKGGGGQGIVSGVLKSSRNASLQVASMRASSVGVAPKQDTANPLAAASVPMLGMVTGKSKTTTPEARIITDMETSAAIAKPVDIGEVNRGIRDDKTSEAVIASNEHLKSSSGSLKSSVDIQEQMLYVLGDISNKLNASTLTETKETTTTSEVIKVSNGRIEGFPAPSVNLQRKKYS